MTTRNILLAACALLVIVSTARTGDEGIQPNAAQQISSLEKQVKSLEARITRLEQAVFVDGSQARQKKPEVRRGEGDWRLLANWSRIKRGMSEAQVIRLLGRPTRTEDIIGRTLFYEGYVDEAKTEVSGNVWLSDNRVSSIEPPVW